MPKKKQGKKRKVRFIREFAFREHSPYLTNW